MQISGRRAECDSQYGVSEPLKCCGILLILYVSGVMTSEIVQEER